MKTTYLKLSIMFDMNSEEEDKAAESMGLSIKENEVPGFIYVRIIGDSAILSFNALIKKEGTAIQTIDGERFSTEENIKLFIAKLKQAGCEIIE